MLKPGSVTKNTSTASPGASRRKRRWPRWSGWGQNEFYVTFLFSEGREWERLSLKKAQGAEQLEVYFFHVLLVDLAQLSDEISLENRTHDAQKDF